MCFFSGPCSIRVQSVAKRSDFLILRSAAPWPRGGSRTAACACEHSVAIGGRSSGSVAVNVLDRGSVAPGDVVARKSEYRRDAVAFLRAGRPAAEQDRQHALLVNLRAVGIGAVQKMNLPKFENEGPDPGPAVVEQQRAYFDGNFLPVNVYDRAKLRAGNRVRGPAIVVQMDATTVIHPNHIGEVDRYLSILIKPDGQA